MNLYAVNNGKRRCMRAVSKRGRCARAPKVIVDYFVIMWSGHVTLVPPEKS